MKFKISILVFLFFSFSTCFAQKEVVSLKIDDKTSMLPRKKGGYNFLNTKTGDFVVVMLDKKMGFANLFDKDFNVKATLTFNSPKYDEVLGYKIIDDRYEILFSNSTKKIFAVISIDFDSKKAVENNFKFDFNDERYLETVQYNNQLFLLTANKNNDFIIRELANNSFSLLKKISISSDNSNQKLLKRNDIFGSLKSNISKVDNRVPNAIEQTAAANKIYLKDNFLYLTIEDEANLQTILYTIDLESLTMVQDIFDYPNGRVGDFKRYNSFILDDKIFQLGSSNNEMKIIAKDFSGESLKEFYIEVNQPIAFKNSPIIQDGQTFIPFVNRRELEETSKYLRKVSSGKIGITGYKDDDIYNITIGGFKEVTSGGGGMMMMGGGYTHTVGTAGGVPVVQHIYNPTYYSFNNYSSTKSTFFNTHFDSELTYVVKEETDNIFDKIKEFKKDLQYESAEDVYIHEGKVYFSYYNLKDKTLRIFEM